ncbi:protein LURP-one-related 11-like [Cryptomeria japonica]|uniref:protein LURP-one-related 11-like n=1 Tax=Cryptomeria japonica TaxID=3369 RepID=UPI0027D9EB5E|nr:protein LURP-one-related 11-like [Cryptomeria japonica]
MAQVHPDSIFSSPHVYIDHKFCSASATHFTVLKKSLLLNGKGFTVFNSLGNLVFRVDNYASISKNEVLLMDDAGHLLLTLRRKFFRKRWEAFRGNPMESEKATFSLVKSLGFSNKITANVFVNGVRKSKVWDYKIKGSCKSSWTIFTVSGETIGQVKRKEVKSDIVLGNDILNLVVEGRVDQAFVMGLLIMFDQIS